MHKALEPILILQKERKGRKEEKHIAQLKNGQKV
jgi:hypothetical protein